MSSAYVPSSDYVYFLAAKGFAAEMLAEHVPAPDGTCTHCRTLGFTMTWPCRPCLSARAAAALAASWRRPHRPGWVPVYPPPPDER
ncbi:hypothetical protein [Pseudonocardia spinosispora]|uniref:hypothetical protein n=1 Tax=Pseudonocardia spinosispora TaxID=103441 RepID=UPI0003FDC00E|nr:hypothetical protein [Pseudonocardia spinosispora]